MDDFLHNLRSGKLKQSDRSNRSYGDSQYKGGQRRNAMDRRKKELDAFERLNAVKDALESISSTQKRMAEAYEARTRAEERKARAMEVLAKNIYRMLNPEAKDVDDLFASDPSPVIAPPMDAPIVEDSEEVSAEAEKVVAEAEKVVAEAEEETEENLDDAQPRKLNEAERQRLFVVIDRMRIAGDNWEKIARHIASQGYSTVSGKGSWRGIMAKTLYEKMLNE
jgi:hypothetical protein